MIIIWTEADTAHWRIYVAPGGDELTQFDLVTLYGFGNLGQDWVKLCFISYPMASHYLYPEYWFVDSLTHRDKILWNLNQRTDISIEGKE